MNPYTRALLRFWWLLVVGVGAGAMAAILAAYHVKLGTPPKFTSRTKSSFTATATLLVDSTNDPYLRTLQTQTTAQPGAARPAPSKSRSGTGSAATVASSTSHVPVVSVGPPDTATLVTAANLFPTLIESDQVAAYRQKLFGPINGSVTATAAFASNNTYGAFKTSPLPVIYVTATADRPKLAVALSSDTAAAFDRWMRHKQDVARIPWSQRIIVDEVRRPTAATSSGKSSKGLPIFIGFVVLLAFGGGAILLDRAFPRRRPAPRIADTVPAGATGGAVAQAIE